MRLLTMMHENKVKIGVACGEGHIMDINAAYTEWPTGDSDGHLADNMLDLLTRGEQALQQVQGLLEWAQQVGQESPSWRVPQDQVRVMAPVPNPSKVVAIGLNYHDHCAEQNLKIPERPLIFAKFPTAVTGPGEAITWNPELTSQVDYEAELGVVMGKRARHVAAADAYQYVAGYVNANDVSARDLQFGDRQWVRGKSLDTFCPLGPYLVTQDEVPDPHALSIRSILNGHVMQNSNTSNLIFQVPALIEFITMAFTLLPGDIILTGTPGGVGVFREPKIFMQPGDSITIEIESLGALTNPVSAWNKP